LQDCYDTQKLKYNRYCYVEKKKTKTKTKTNEQAHTKIKDQKKISRERGILLITVSS